MNRIIGCIPAIALLVGAGAFATPALTLQQCNDYPFVRTDGPVTHRQIINELEELEAVGYEPGLGDDSAFPDELTRAERRLWDKYAAECPVQRPMAETPARITPTQ